ncbi:hypothetical protein JCM3770_000745 [Rhodotorula araucariae]
MEGFGDGAAPYSIGRMRSDDPQHARPPLPPGQPSAGPSPAYTPYSFSPPGVPSSFSPNNPPFHTYTAAMPLLEVQLRRDEGGEEEALSPPPSSCRTPGTEVQVMSSISATLQHGARTGDDSDMLADEVAGTSSTRSPRIVQKADRSCKKCRERRVRCGREFPTCARCKKRRDACSYGEGVYVEETLEGSDQQRIADLESKISSLQIQLRNATSAATPRPSIVSSSSSPSPALTRDSLALAISRALTDLLSPADTAVVSAFVAEEGRTSGHSTPSFGSAEFRLASAGLASALTCHLLDTAVRACDSKLPALSAISSRISFFKSKLHELEPHDQVNVATLCALGARTSPHAPCFGISSVTSTEGKPIPALFATAGTRRETMCQTLEKRARETAWATGLFRTQTYEAAEAIAALTMLGLHEENDPEETRWFVRQAVGLFLDLRHSEMLSDTTSSLGRGIGLALFLADAQLAVRCSRPTVISPSDLQDYWATSGLVIPDLVNPKMPDMVDEKLISAMSYNDVRELIDTILFYVYACYRVFAQVTGPARRSDSSSVLGFIRSLWNLIDQIHNAIQRLQQHLVALTAPFPGMDGDPHAVDHVILLSVLADDVLVHLVGYVHRYLLWDRNLALYGPEREGDEELDRIRGESSMRVFKCLKLFAFYCQLYCGSQDKHNVFHLLMQLAPLPNWAELVTLRIGQPGGPLTDEFEVNEEEVEWFRVALELSLFYSPRLGPSLEALAAARQKHMSKAPPESQRQAPPFPTHATPHADYAPQPPPVSSPTASASSLHYAYSQSDSHLSPTAPFTGVFAVPAAAAAQFPPDAPNFSPTSSRHGTQQQQPPDLPLGFAFDRPAPTPAPSAVRRQQQEQEQMQRAAPHGATAGGLPQEGFADGAVEDLAGLATDVRSAFRSVDWADLSLAPAPMVGSDGSSGSMEDWIRGGELGPGAR